MTKSFEDLAGADLTTLVAWLVSDQAGIAELTTQQRLGLVEALTSRLTSAADEIADGDWHQIAKAYDAAIQSAGQGEVSNAIRTLNLMSVLLRRVQPMTEVSLRNPDYGAKIFLHAAELEVDQAADLASDWRQGSREDLLRLRNAKNMLRPLVTFSHLFTDPDSTARIREWATLLPKLP